MELQFVSNQRDDYQEHLDWIRSELPFIQCSDAPTIQKNQTLVLIYPDQYAMFVDTFLSEEMKGKTLYVLLNKGLTEEQRCRFLNNGMDIIWNFSLSKWEFLTSLKALLRLSKRNQAPDMINYNEEEMVLHLETQQVYIEGRKVDLTASEYLLLLQFAQYPGRIYSRDDLLSLLNSHRGTHRSIDTHIKNLRRKIALHHRTYEYIQTIHGRGYRFEPQTVE
jgi:Response regulators consisting of a CheY-like receiver domain and a winged-helix DNA-binding domain